MAETIQVDALVVGGGVAGLFTLRSLLHAGRTALLVERVALGTGQTTASQGILHAGVKYALGGTAGDDAREASAAAAGWNSLLDGTATPDLRGLRVLAREEFLWRTQSLMGLAGMLGARLALRTRPEPVDAARRPGWLAGVRGDVLSLPETVIDPGDLLARLADPVRAHLALGQVETLAADAETAEAEVAGPAGRVRVRARRVFLCAGMGNGPLLEGAGLGAVEPMQRRPLRQAMIRGPLPMAFGHCIDGAKTRITVTSERLGEGVVWHIGGEIAERGPSQEEAEFLRQAREEVLRCLPGLDLERCEWSSYLVDRAEPRTRDGRRPDAAHVRAHGAIVATWPVKLVLAPTAAREALAHMPGSSGSKGRWPDGWPAPPLARRPWEEATWSRLP
jgi:glycine/D-amino acid oxidase-like deaminating enzyme